MQLGGDAEANDKRWAAVPALAAISPLGGAKPGASVLAVTGGPGGAPRALVAVQRFGEGRVDGLHGRSVVALAHDAADLGSVVRAVLAAGGALARAERARAGHRHAACGAGARRRHPGRRSPRATAGIAPRADASIDVRVTSPSGRVESRPRGPAADRSRGQFRAAVRAAEAGVYRVAVGRAPAAQTPLGSSAATMLVGGVDPEMTDPRLNEDTLQRVARASGGAVSRRAIPADCSRG